MHTATLRTSCTRDCPDACGLLATVEEGKVVRLAGDPEHPITRGFLCYRVGTHYLARHHSAERLRAPLLRQADGAFREIGWDEALAHAAARLAQIRAESGGAAILHVQGGGSLGILKNLNGLFFRLLGATRTRGDVCDGAGSAANLADFGAGDANELSDLEHARTIVLWGKNVTASSPHVTPLLKEARSRGAKSWLIDPLPHRSRALVDRYVAVKPGRDGALALAIARVIDDRGLVHPELRSYAEGVDEYLALLRSRDAAAWAALADVPLAQVSALAEDFGRGGPVTTLIGWGMQRRVNGANQVRHVNALHALTGNVGIPGGSASFGTTRRAPFDLSFVARHDSLTPRTIALPRLGAEIEAAAEPPIRAVVVDNGNPVATNPDSSVSERALRSREFVLVLDSFLTDTARAAHLVLPVKTMLEEEDVVGSYGHHHVGAVQPVAEPPSGVRSDLEIYQELARRLGFGEAMAGSPRRWIDRLLAPLATDGVTYDSLIARPHRAGPRIAFEGRRFPTPSGRFRFVGEWLDAERLAPPSSAYPLVLHGLSTGRWQASQLTDADEEREGDLTVTVHPATAAGIGDGEEAWLESDVGKLRVRVVHDPAYRRDTVYVPRARSHRLGRCVNAIVAARLTDLGEGAAYYDEGVRLRPLDSNAS